MSIPITDACRACGAMLAKVSERFACRECYNRGDKYPPTLCAKCLERHKEAGRHFPFALAPTRP